MQNVLSTVYIDGFKRMSPRANHSLGFQKIYKI